MNRRKKFFIRKKKIFLKKKKNKKTFKKNIFSLKKTKFMNEVLIENQEQNVLNVDKNKVKKVYFNLSQKGGIGKSFLTQMMAQQSLLENKKMAVISLDITANNSTNIAQHIRQEDKFKFLNGGYFSNFSLLDKQNNNIERKNLFENVIEEFLKENIDKYDLFVFDFGAGESEQLIHIFDDFSVEIFSSYEKFFENKIKFHFNILIGGQENYAVSIDYLNSILSYILNEKKEPIIDFSLIANLNFFSDGVNGKNYLHLKNLIEKISSNFPLLNLAVLDVRSSVGKGILTSIQDGLFVQKIKTIPTRMLFENYLRNFSTNVFSRL